jgi:hypothetical protein
MVSYQVLLASDEHLVRIVVPEVLLVHEGQLGYIGQRPDVVRMDVSFLHPDTVKVGERVESVNKGLQQLELKGLEVGPDISSTRGSQYLTLSPYGPLVHEQRFGPGWQDVTACYSMPR